MTELSAWFARQAERERRVPCLADALLGNHFWAYAWYRLRYFFVRYVASVLVHATRVIFLYQLFSRRDFTAILTAHVAANLIISFWWGALEEMRDRVRRFYRAGQPYAIGGEIDRWLVLSGVIALVTVLIGLAWLTWTIAVHQMVGVAQLYGLSIVLRLACDVVLRTFHSGVYAIRRIYRPLWSLIGVEIVGFSGFLIFAPVVGAWAFPISTIVGTLVVTALAWHFTWRSYRFVGVEPFELRALTALPAVRIHSVREMVASGLSYALMRLDSIVVLGLFGLAATDGHDLFLLFFLISPTIQAGFDWAQLFYFDFKRLDVRICAQLRRRYARGVVRLSWAIGLVFWALACVTGTVFLQRNLGIVYWLMAPFFVSRSLLASVQIRAFSSRRYPELLGNSLIWLVGFGAVATFAAGDQWRLVGLSAVTFLTYFALRSVDVDRVQHATGRELRGLPEWLAEVTRVQEPMRIRWLSFSAPEAGPDRQAIDRHNRWACRQIAEKIARRAASRGAVTALNSGTVIWYERGRRDRGPRRAWLAAIAGGFLRSLGDTGLAADGVAALRAAGLAGLSEIEAPGAMDADVAPPGRDELRSYFSGTFRDGGMYAVEGAGDEFFDRLTSRERRAIMADAIAFGRDFRPSRNSQRFDVTALCGSGVLEWIFVIDRRVDRSVRSHWRDLVKAANVRAAVQV